MKQEKKLEEAKRLYQTANAGQRYVLESLFPELKESEDEKNIKDLIDELKCSLKAANCQNDACNEGHEKRIALLEWAIAYVEKQGKKSVEWNREDEQNLNACLSYIPDEFLRRWLKYVLHIKYDKPTDKVEPKFHSGQWCIDNEDGATFQIVKVLDNTYTYKTNEGKEYSCTHYSLENDAKLWTINDAKDGDVLVDVYGNISIYEKCDDFDWMSYCSLGHNGGFQHFKIEHENEKTYPATKEQRDLLFQKIREAGYKWDAENKQLLSLKAEPTREIKGNEVKISPKWSKEDEEEFKIAIETLHEAGQHSSAMWLKSIKQRIAQ